ESELKPPLLRDLLELVLGLRQPGSLIWRQSALVLELAQRRNDQCESPQRVVSMGRQDPVGPDQLQLRRDFARMSPSSRWPRLESSQQPEHTHVHRRQQFARSSRGRRVQRGGIFMRTALRRPAATAWLLALLLCAAIHAAVAPARAADPNTLEI